MKKKSSLKPPKTKEQKESEKIISESDYINIIIIHNIDENKLFTAFSLKSLFIQLKQPNFHFFAPLLLARQDTLDAK